MAAWARRRCIGSFRSRAARSDAAMDGPVLRRPYRARRGRAAVLAGGDGLGARDAGRRFSGVDAAPGRRAACDRRRLRGRRRAGVAGHECPRLLGVRQVRADPAPRPRGAAAGQRTHRVARARLHRLHGAVACGAAVLRPAGGGLQPERPGGPRPGGGVLLGHDRRPAPARAAVGGGAGAHRRARLSRHLRHAAGGPAHDSPSAARRRRPASAPTRCPRCSGWGSSWCSCCS